MIRISCENCGKQIGVPDKYLGKYVECPSCKQPTLVPETAAQSTVQKEPPKKSSVKIMCPHCKNKMVVGGNTRGKVIKCFTCLNPLRVPAARDQKDNTVFGSFVETDTDSE